MRDVIQSYASQHIASVLLLQAIEEDSVIHRALTRLSPLRRELVALAFFQGLTHDEIARKTRLPIGTVKSHIRRALATMRAELAGRGNEQLR